MAEHSAVAIHDDRKLPALTGVRFFAAAAVLVSHFSAHGAIVMPGSVIDFLDGGRTAVSLFFVLSGFILTYNYSTLTGAAARMRFYVNRVARIYPVVLLALLIGAVGVTVALTASDPKYLRDWYSLESPSVIALVGSFLAQITVTTGWFPAARINQPWNGPAWSIACEMFFYVLFPFLIAWARNRRAWTIAIALVCVFLTQVLLIVGARTFAPAGQRGFLVSQFPPTHLFDFVIGMAAGLFFLKGGREWLAAGYRRTGTLLAAMVPLALLAYFRPIDPAYLLMTPFFALLVLGLASPPSRRPSVLAARPLLLLGEASFSLYLIHVPLLNLFSLANPSPLVGWALMAVTVGLSILIFKTFETPARMLVKRVLAPRAVAKPERLSSET